MIKNCFLALLTLCSVAVMAQPKLNSPYTRYGMGILSPKYFAAQSGRGGLTTAFSDPYHLNLANPASFGSLRSTALETGLYAQNSNFKSGASELNVWSGNLAYFALGFTMKSPINEALDRTKSNWRHGMGISLTPYSVVGYDVQVLDTVPDLGIVDSKYQGSGGTYRLAWHGATKYKNTAFGLTLGWMFGRSKYENTTAFLDSLPTFQNNFTDQYAVGGIVWTTGIQHDFILKYAENDKDAPTKWITLGATAEGKHRLNAATDIIRLRSRGKDISTGNYVDADTISFQQGLSKTVTLPSVFSVGIDYVKADKFKLGAQVTFEQWKNYKNEVRPESLKNTWGAAAGFEYIPDNFSYNRYMKRVRYRVGAYFKNDPRQVQDKDLTDVGVTLGMGFPLILPRQQTSFVNFGLEAGRFGVKSPIEETYIRLTLGFTFNDNTWFYKRRFE